MNNNDILRKLRYTFKFNDDRVMALFDSGGRAASRTEISAWLKKVDDADFVFIPDRELAAFLNGFINFKRGKRSEKQPLPEENLNNNIIFRKIKIALNLKVEDIVEIYKLVGMRVSKHEINAFFRKPQQNQYRRCLDQFLRNFLFGLQRKYRDFPATEMEK